MTALYEAMVTERMAQYSASREAVERAAKAFWTTNEHDDPIAFADSIEVQNALGGTSFALDDYLRYFASSGRMAQTNSAS